MAIQATVLNYDPYRKFKFLVWWEGAGYVAAVSKISALTRHVDPIDWRTGGDPNASLFLLESSKGEWRNGDRDRPKTAIQKAVAVPNGLAFLCDDGTQSSFVEWKDGQWSPRQEMEERVEPLAFVRQDIDSDGNPDLLSLGRTHMCLLAHSVEGKRLLTSTWQLPAGPPPLGPITTVRNGKDSMIVYPDRAGKVMAIIQSLRGGRDNDPGFGSRMRGQGAWADLLRTRFGITCRKLGLNRERIILRSDLFVPPSGAQMRLF